MRRYIIILIWLFLKATASTIAQSHANSDLCFNWVVESNSSLFIEGSSNISRFRCDVTEYMGTDTLVCKREGSANKLFFSRSTLTIAVNRFDCHQRFITSDFRKTLHANEQPELKIQFISLDAFVTAMGGDQTLKGLVQIELAGIKRTEEIIFTIRMVGVKKYYLAGSKVLRFSSFHLKPPRKLAGLIRIEEEIKVNFNLMLNSIS